MPIHLLNIDLHISVITDVLYILKDIYGDNVDIKNHSISGHNWVFDRETAIVNIINQDLEQYLPVDIVA